MNCVRHIRPLRLLGAVLLLAGAANLRADDVQRAAPAAVARVLAGNLLELTDSRIVRLAGIRLAGDPNADTTQEMAERARAVLAGLVENRGVRLEPADTARDRHGRWVAQLWRDDGIWLQGALLEQGLVQVQTRPGEIAMAAEMMAQEMAARRSGIGIWAQKRFAPRWADRLDGLEGSFQIVQGRVVRAAPTDYYLYLNFGADWRSDFTLRIARRTLQSFEAAGIDLEQLAGRQVEVRGYLLYAGGPLIELSHPEQIRIEPDG